MGFPKSQREGGFLPLPASWACQCECGQPPEGLQLAGSLRAREERAELGAPRAGLAAQSPRGFLSAELGGEAFPGSVCGGVLENPGWTLTRAPTSQRAGSARDAQSAVFDRGLRVLAADSSRRRFIFHVHSAG